MSSFESINVLGSLINLKITMSVVHLPINKSTFPTYAERILSSYSYTIFLLSLFQLFFYIICS